MPGGHVTPGLATARCPWCGKRPVKLSVRDGKLFKHGTVTDRSVRCEGSNQKPGDYRDTAA